MEVMDIVAGEPEVEAQQEEVMVVLQLTEPQELVDDTDKIIQAHLMVERLAQMEVGQIGMDRLAVVKQI